MTEEAIEKLVDFLVKTRGVTGALRHVHNLREQNRTSTRLTMRLVQEILKKEKKS